MDCPKCRFVMDPFDTVYRKCGNTLGSADAAPAAFPSTPAVSTEPLPSTPVRPMTPAERAAATRQAAGPAQNNLPGLSMAAMITVGVVNSLLVPLLLGAMVAGPAVLGLIMHSFLSTTNSLLSHPPGNYTVTTGHEGIALHPSSSAAGTPGTLTISPDSRHHPLPPTTDSPTPNISTAPTTPPIMPNPGSGFSLDLGDIMRKVMLVIAGLALLGALKAVTAFASLGRRRWAIITISALSLVTIVISVMLKNYVGAILFDVLPITVLLAQTVPEWDEMS